MNKSKSFSSYGRNLEIRKSTKNNPQTIMRNTQRALSKPIQISKTQPKWIEGFDRVTGRDKPNSFQIFNTKDFCRHANYDIKQQLVQTRSSFYPVRKQKQPRLNLLFTAPSYEPGTQMCRKLPSTEKNQHILTAQDLQQFRKSHHSIDFQKQLKRSNNYIKKPVALQSTDTQNFKSLTIKDQMKTSKLQTPKLKKVHSFDSYTKRQFLSEKKLAVKGAPFHSGAESFKIPLQKFKGSWKTINQTQFQKSPDKHLNRYDAINPPFYTKLGYYPKQKLVTKKIPIFSIKHQKSRQINEVHSKYPIRITI